MPSMTASRSDPPREEKHRRIQQQDCPTKKSNQKWRRMDVDLTGHSCALNPLVERQFVDLRGKTNKDECQSIEDQHISNPVGVRARTPQVGKSKQESEVTAAEVWHGRPFF